MSDVPSHGRSSRIQLLITLGVILSLTATACGSSAGDDDEATTSQAAGTDTAQPTEPGEITLGSAVEQDAANVAFLIASEQGLYEACGLNVEVVHFQGGGALMPALTANEVQFGWVGTTTVLAAREAGAPLKTIAEVNQTAQGWGLMVPEDSDIRTVDDLSAGARISFTSEGALSHWFALYAMSEAGLEPDDMVGVPLGGSLPTIRNSLESGDIDAAIVLIPWGHILEQEGFRWVTKFWETLPELNFTGLHANETTLEDADTASRMVGAYASAVEWMTENREETVAFMADFYDLEDELASTVYDLVVPDYDATGEFEQEKMQFLIDTVAPIPGFIEGTVTVEDVLQQVPAADC